MRIINPKPIKKEKIFTITQKDCAVAILLCIKKIKDGPK